jgi:UDP-N-acetylmuramyl pentapeptide phosphotransferase/UDP-N-acetylglucosamine-1-phosphate transferase
MLKLKICFPVVVTILMIISLSLGYIYVFLIDEYLKNPHLARALSGVMAFLVIMILISYFRVISSSPGNSP